VVNRFRLLRAVALLRQKGTDVRALAEIVTESGRQLKNLRASILRSRMIPVSELLERIPLLVRGLTAANGKRVRVRIDAGAAELDKAVAERIFPAIVHLVRNAVDHAIEPPEIRLRAGKPAEGLVEVTCFERGANQLELTIRDDGAGVDREKVARRAGREVPASNEGLLALLTISGLSTADRATTTSGRGIGMDIVRRIAVDGLGGELTLDSTSDRGTQFTVRIPLTITIQDSFSFRCGDQLFVVPVSTVEEIIEVDPRALVAGAAFRAQGAEVELIERRGVALPLISLDALLNVVPVRQALRKAIVVRRNGELIAFEVDQIVGQQEVVVRPLEDPLVRVPGVTGATDLGDGRPTLMLDLVTLAGIVGSPTKELTA
jgi:two-component system chemotaxis sensor kinase CheA